MVKAPQGYRHRTRRLLRKNVRERGGVPKISVLLREYNVGDRVAIKIDPSFHSSMPHRRYHGLTGVIQGKRGSCYIVEVYLGGKRKTLFVSPIHLRPLPAQTPN
jgi:LSU ribosomal protein L21E